MEQQGGGTGYRWPVWVTTRVLASAKKSAIGFSIMAFLGFCGALLACWLLALLGFPIGLSNYLSGIGVFAIMLAWAWLRYIFLKRRVATGAFGDRTREVKMVESIITEAQSEAGITKPDQPWTNEEQRAGLLMAICNRDPVIPRPRSSLPSMVQMAFVAFVLCAVLPSSYFWIPVLSESLGPSEQLLWYGIMGGFVVTSAWGGLLAICSVREGNS
ncbi:hypothetical protein A2764_00755 [Candidatus Kaiserbacteria bacterium RIFCSPHIGHO2_01_FULL_55_79]|nr:MAG: hypothetical protein A2764_00755 [Candidatus Kaiserbacteria bacterium RIFCSPHIGHO2_01_FULL_55_79]OGG77355.1 MAG: hypothetical protein A3F56_03945 [Candidatus Kaiserbacteria bacterium RIFCSPHIGHO2_12_FULL_55_13]